MHPNIELSDKENSFFFHKGKEKISDISFYEPNLSKIRTDFVNLQNYEYICVISSIDNLSIKKVIDFLKKKNVQKIYFFIEDVFRFKTSSFDESLFIYLLEKDIDSVQILELELINQIINKLNIKYEIYHCEHRCNLVSKKYNKTINYFDIFLNNYVDNLISQERFNSNFINKFEYKISCFNYRKEIHRQLISNTLVNHKDVLLTLIEKSKKDYVFQNEELPLDSFSNDLKHIIKKNQKTVEKKSLILPKEYAYIKKNQAAVKNSDYLLSQIQNSFANLITETRFCSTMPNISEKTIKPILIGRPFIMLGPAGNLELIKKLGFKTFDKWWDEDYDMEKNHVKRFEKVYYVVKELLNKDHSSLEKMLIEMQDVLIHNYNNMKNLYTNTKKILYIL